MTAVGPSPLDTVIDFDDGKTSDSESLFFVNNNLTKRSERVAIEENIEAKRKKTMADGLRPLLASMKLFGLYFNRRLEETDGEDDVKNARRWNATTIYGAVVVTLLWVNSVRMLSVFTREDRFGMVLFNKLVMVVWAIQCATSQTAFYAASFSGRLAVVLRQTLDDACARHSNRFAIVLATVAWSIITVSLACMIYVNFFTQFTSDVMITPFQIHIILSHPVVPHIIAQVIMFYQVSVYIFSQAMTFVLALIFSHQFQKVSADLGSCLDNPRRQVSEVDIETFRQKHQRIAMTVSDLDDSLMFSNASAFCCQLFCFIIMLYIVIFYHFLMVDPVTIATHVFWILLMFFGLTLTAASGVIVHHYVSFTH